MRFDAQGMDLDEENLHAETYMDLLPGYRLPQSIGPSHC